MDHSTITNIFPVISTPLTLISNPPFTLTPSTSSVLSLLPQLQEAVLAVQRLRVEHSRVVELSSKLVKERLDLEQQLEDMQAMHRNKMEQMASRGKQLGSCQQVEQLSGVGAAVIQDVKMLRQQFRLARQEVDSMEDQLKEMEKREMGEKEATAREKDEQQTKERLGKLLMYNMKQLEEEQNRLGLVLQAGREANNCLHQDRIVMGRMVRLMEEENRGLEERVWEMEVERVEGNKCLGNGQVDDQKVLGHGDDNPKDVEAEENRLEVVLGEKLCELESVQNCLEGSHKIVAQMRNSALGEEEGKQVVRLEVELKDVLGQWEEEQKGWQKELGMMKRRIDSLEDLKELKERRSLD